MKKKAYNSYSVYIKKLFFERVQKLSVNAGFTCPNRDGTLGNGGCIYCDNSSFKPDYCTPESSIIEQLDQGISIFSNKYKTQKYIAYFQAFTNTYAPVDKLICLYEAALAHKSVIGLVIATRPDCIEKDIIDYLSELSKTKYLLIEIGIESTIESTLKFINRGHTYSQSEKAVRNIAERGINVGAHMIIGFPGEDHEHILSHARRLSELPLTTLKLHQLQILKGTKLADWYRNNPGQIVKYSAEEYIDLVIDFLENLNPGIVIERFISESPPEMLISPKWGLKNFEFIAKLEKRMAERNTWQGRLISEH